MASQVGFILTQAGLTVAVCLTDHVALGRYTIFTHDQIIKKATVETYSTYGYHGVKVVSHGDDGAPRECFDITDACPQIIKEHELHTHMTSLIRAQYDLPTYNLEQNGTPQGHSAGNPRMLELCLRESGDPGTSPGGGHPAGTHTGLYMRDPNHPDCYRLLHVPGGFLDAPVPSLPIASGSSSQPPNPPDTASQQRATGTPPTLPIQLKRIAELALAQTALLQGQDHRSPEEKAEATHQPESPREPANSHNDDISDHPLDDDLGSAQAPINLEDRDEGVELIYFKRAGEHPYIPMPLVKDVSVLIPSVDEVLPSWPKPAVNNLLDSFKAEFEETNAGRVRSLWLCGDDYQRLIDSDPVGLACQLWPDADDKELRMATDLVIWATSWDILLKTSGPMYHHAFKSRIDWFKLRVDMAAESVWVSYGDEVDRPDLVEENLDCYDARKVIDRVLSFMNDVYGQESLVVMDSFADAVCAYMDATGAATRLWANGEVLTPDDYREKCMGRGHISPLVMLPPVKGYAWDPYSSECYDELLHQATRIIRLTNDIFSVKEDMAMGNISSSVIVRFVHTRDITDALLDACRELKTARESFEETVLEIAHTRKDNTVTQRFRTKADYLRQLCVGNWMWSVGNKRWGCAEYRQPDGSIMMDF